MAQQCKDTWHRQRLIPVLRRGREAHDGGYLGLLVAQICGGSSSPCAWHLMHVGEQDTHTHTLMGYKHASTCIYASI